MSSSSGSSHDCDSEDIELQDFLSSFDPNRLCAAASVLRSKIGSESESQCSLGEKTIGGYNVLLEIIFADGVKWLARCALPYNCSSQDGSDELMRSYAAALKYIKLHTSIPVPEVMACCTKSDKGNEVGVSYMLLERIPGRTLDFRLPVHDVRENDEDYQPTCDAAEKVFRQLAGIIMQLASLQFNQIGVLREQSVGSGAFSVGPYLDAGILFPPERGQIYEAFESSSKGPFRTVSEYHSAVLSLNEKYAEEDQDADYLRSVDRCRLIRPKISLPQYEDGPFVLGHDDLSSSNILLDDDYNITGILDFPGTIVPLPALCVYPHLFQENHCSPFTDRKIWLRCMLHAQPVPGSALNDLGVRELLMETALARGNFDLALSHVYGYLAIASLARKLGVEEADAGHETQNTVVTIMP